MAMRTRIPWSEKMKRPEAPRIVPVPAKWRRQYGAGPMLISRPADVDAAIREVRSGALITMEELRGHLARAAGADSACPLTTGIFLRIVAEAAEERRSAGAKRITPWWRVVQSDGTLNPRLPGGGELQAQRLREEGHQVVAARRKLRPLARAPR